MKKIILLFLFLLCVNTVYAQVGYLGDGLGSYKLQRELRGNLQNITNLNHFSCITFLSSGTAYITQALSHWTDPNTGIILYFDQAVLQAGGKKGIHLFEGALDIIYLGDDTWDYMVFGDTTNAMVEISTYVYTTQLWRLRNLEVFFGGKFSSITVLTDLIVGGTVYADVGNFDEVITSTIHAKSPLHLDSPEVTVPLNATYDGVDISSLDETVKELSASTLVLYYTNEIPPSSGYLLMTDTIPAGAESTVVSAMSASTVIVTSFTVETVLGLSALRAGLYHSHFHAEMNNTNRDVRLRFEVWNGTGTGETFLFSSEQSDLMTANKAIYDIHVSTNEIITTVNYLAIRIVADVTGAAAAPNLTFYMEGANSSAFEMPALLSDVGVTRIIPGTNTNVSPTGGKGDITVNVDVSPEFHTVELDTITSSGAEIHLKKPTTHYGSQWGRGHDSKGWDNSSANSFTVFDEYTLPTADGDADDIMETNGAGVLSWVAPEGAGGGNKNDEENLEAEQFATAGGTNNASIYKHQKEITYDGVTSTGAMFTVKLPDSARPNHTFASMNWSKQWDDGTVNIYVTFVTSSTSDGTANLRVGIGTCTFVGANFEIYDSTAQVGSGWCDQRTATMTILSTSILFDGKHIIVHLGRGSEDTCTQTVYGLNVKFGYVKD